MTNLISVAGIDWSPGWRNGMEYVVTASDSQTTYSDFTIDRRDAWKLGFHGSGFLVGSGNMELMNHIYSELRKLQNETGDLGPLHNIGELVSGCVSEFSDPEGNDKDLSLIMSGVPETGHLNHLKKRYVGGKETKCKPSPVLSGGIGAKPGEDYHAQSPSGWIGLMTDLEVAINLALGVSRYAARNPAVNEWVQLGILTRKKAENGDGYGPIEAYAFYPNDMISGHALPQKGVSLTVKNYHNLEQLWNLVDQHVLNRPAKAAFGTPQTQIPGIPAYR